MAPAPDRLTVLILGGYGVFGGRLAGLLADEPRLELVIAGRHLAAAEAFCARLHGAATVRPLRLDRRDIATALRDAPPGLVVDASGPFQDYGADRYAVIEACLAARVDYLDFADAADFVFGVPAFDERARAAGIFALSGVSSFPVLTAAVLRHMARDMEIVRVEGGIAPSPYAGVGLNVMRAVLGYAGAPVRLRRDGRDAEGTGLVETMRYTVAPPGRLPLRNLRFSLVDVPDLRVLPPAHPAMTDIWMGAGPVPEVLHRLLNLLAAARARFGLPSLVPLARLCYLVLNLMKLGEHRGGMFIRVRGRADGRPVERSWHLLAEGDDGPLIPSMAIEALVRRLLDGKRPAAGARSGADALDLADYQRLFRGRAITTGFREDETGRPLYRRLLASAWDDLPPPVRLLHDRIGERTWVGRAAVRRGRGPLARMVAGLVGFPRAGDDVPVTVTFAPEDDGGERWTRTFAGRRFTSHQRAGTGRDDRLLVERFGLATFSLALVVEGDRLLLVPRRWSLLGVPMPLLLLPRGTSFETAREGRFAFDVEVRLPTGGLVVAYSGTLEPA